MYLLFLRDANLVYLEKGIIMMVCIKTITSKQANKLYIKIEIYYRGKSALKEKTKTSNLIIYFF